MACNDAGESARKDETCDNPARIPLKDRQDLSIYWDNHLRVAFNESVPHDIPAMIEASIAHVLVLGSQNSLPPDRVQRLTRGLLQLWEEFGPGEVQPTWQPRPVAYHFDGSVEDPYYFLEQRLAHACQIAPSELDVQLGRSRNDLDAGVFRMILRRAVVDVAGLTMQTAQDLLDKAQATKSAVIIGNTHRRPAQPTTIAHVLTGLAETLISQTQELLAIFDEMNVSPLGSAAFAGTDIGFDEAQIAELLGFTGVYTASYEAVAGAEHLIRYSSALSRITATGARWARVLQEWMGLGWVKTPKAFTQGSSIMPQKVNPVVLEHMVSMAGANLGDMTSTYATIGAGWYEDSNNATTDVQKYLWAATERTIRFLKLYDGLILELEPYQLPSTEEIIKSGATTTAVAEALAKQGIPWRGAHDLVGTLFAGKEPTQWDTEYVAAALAEHDLPDPDGTLLRTIMESGQEPQRVLQRTQVGSPGTDAITESIRVNRARLQAQSQEFRSRSTHLDTQRRKLLAEAELVAHGDATDQLLSNSAVKTSDHAQRHILAKHRLTVIGNTNLDVMTYGAAGIPSPGVEEIIPEIHIRLGGSAGIAAARAATLGLPTQLVSKVGPDASAQLLRELTASDHLTASFITQGEESSALTIAFDGSGVDRSFLSYLGAMQDFTSTHIPEDAYQCDMFLSAGYFLLPHFQGAAAAAALHRAQQAHAQTALDTGHPDGGWNDVNRTELMRVVLPHVNYFLPNETELLWLAGVDDLEEAAQLITRETGATVVAKLGDRGAMAYLEGQAHYIAAPQVTPRDTTGAGDTFNAAFLTNVVAGVPLVESAQRAVETASAIIQAPPQERDALLVELQREWS